MHDPFEMPESAFEPFFTRRIAFSAKRPAQQPEIAPPRAGLGAARSPVVIAGTLPCCIFDEGYAEVYDEHNAASKIGRIVIYIRKHDWAASCPSAPQSGDRFTSPDTGRTYALTTVTHFCADTWSIEAREVKQ